MTIDQRLEFLLKSTESLHANAQETTAQLQELGTKVDLLAEAVKGLVFITQSHQQRLNKLEG